MKHSRTNATSLVVIVASFVSLFVPKVRFARTMQTVRTVASLNSLPAQSGSFVGMRAAFFCSEISQAKHCFQPLPGLPWSEASDCSENDARRCPRPDPKTETALEIRLDHGRCRTRQRSTSCSNACGRLVRP